MSDLVAALPVGSRVVVRWRLERADEVTGATLTDAVGTLATRDEDTLTVETSSGPVEIERARVVAAKQVPPRPARRGAPHRAIGIDDLERIMVDGWPPVERAFLGDWVLRASSGFTGRANSALAVGSPGVPVAEAVDHVEGWYAARGQHALVTLSGPEGFDVRADPVGSELLTRGYCPRPRVLVMTAAIREVAARLEDPEAEPGASALPVHITDSLEPAWLEAYGRQRPVVPGATETVLTGSPGQLFGSVRDGGEVAAVARLSIAHAWAGLCGVWVDPARRRAGLAQALTAGLATAARQRGIRSVWLQVERENAPALTLYRRLGFGVHHAYEHLEQPDNR